METSVIKVGGMSCQGCVRNVTGVLTALPGVATADVLLAAGEVRASFAPRIVARGTLVAAIEEAGFDAE